MFLSFMFVWRGVCNMDLALTLNDWLPMHSMDVAKPLHKRIKRPYVSKRRSWHAVACRILTGSTNSKPSRRPKMHCIIALQKYHVLGPFGMKFELATNRPTRCWCSCSMGTWNAWIPYAVYHANMWYTNHTLEGITIEFRFCFSGRITPKKH